MLDEAPITACIEDVKCSVRWLRAHAETYNVDPDRIGAYGNSAGAHLVAMLGLCPPSAGLEGDGPWQHHPSMVQAVVSSATPTSFLGPMNERLGPISSDNTPDAVGRRMPANIPYLLPEEIRKKISPITYVRADAPPFLMVHEESDAVVGVWQTSDFVQALQEAGAKDVTFMHLEDGSGHGAFFRNSSETVAAMEAFFQRNLTAR